MNELELKTFIKSNVDGDEISFENGTLYVSCYSYPIDTIGEMKLSKRETLRLYQAMKAYYEK